MPSGSCTKPTMKKYTGSLGVIQNPSRMPKTLCRKPLSKLLKVSKNLISISAPVFPHGSIRSVLTVPLITSEKEKREKPTGVIAKQAISQVNDALDILTPKQRMIFDLRHLQHKALKEISDHLQCSQSTVKTQLQRAVTKLRNRLEPLWREE